MTRNLKTLGLALVAALTLGAIGAQGVPAAVEHSFRSAANSTVLTGHIDGGNHLFEVGDFKVECPIATFEGKNVGEVRDTVTVHPKYGSCTASGFLVEVDTHGCNFILDSDTTISAHSSGNEHATVSIECEVGHHMMITTQFCSLTISASHNNVPVNQSLHGISYSSVMDSSKHSLATNWTVETIHYTALSGSACQFWKIAAGTHSDGVLTGKATLTGYEGDSPFSGSTTLGHAWSHGAQVDITISTPT